MKTAWALWRKVSWKERYFLSLGKFPEPRETEHASRTVPRHETEVTECSHVEMPLNRGSRGKASISDRRANEVKGEGSLLSWRASQVRRCQWAERL